MMKLKLATAALTTVCLFGQKPGITESLQPVSVTVIAVINGDSHSATKYRIESRIRERLALNSRVRTSAKSDAWENFGYLVRVMATAHEQSVSAYVVASFTIRNEFTQFLVSKIPEASRAQFKETLSNLETVMGVYNVKARTAADCGDAIFEWFDSEYLQR